MNPKPGSLRLDLQNIELPDESFDIVFASHVLEHVLDDNRALREIWRILRPGGRAILPVPITADKTIEYGEARPSEHFHVRAPGMDYFDRYCDVFGRVDVIRSRDFADEYQVWVVESETGRRIEDAVPICIK